MHALRVCAWLRRQAVSAQHLASAASVYTSMLLGEGTLSLAHAQTRSHLQHQRPAGKDCRGRRETLRP
jgi:hypothetical protein